MSAIKGIILKTPFKDLLLDLFFTVRLPQEVEIHVREIGMVYRVAQIGVFLFVGLRLFLGDTWAHKERPIGTVNAWPDPGTWAAVVNAGNYNANLPYCGDLSYSFAYDANFVMDSPVCERLHPWEITTKAFKQRVEFTTAFIETRELAWVSGGGNDAANTALCTARSGTLSTNGNQKLCVSERTVFPVGVESMVMAFEHEFEPAEDISSLKIRGSSNIPAGQMGAIDSYVYASNGTEVAKVPSGTSISLTIREWLELAGLSLEDSNTDLAPDYRHPDKRVRYRTSGVSLEVKVKFDNRDKDSRKLTADSCDVYGSCDVYAVVSVEADTGVWAGSGPQVHYEQFPMYDANNAAEEYDKVYRYRQAIIFTFRPTGLLYVLDYYLAFSTIISGLVLLAVARYTTIAYALYFHPMSSMMRNATRSVFDIKRRLGHIGMKAALAADQFGRLDADGDSLLQVPDLCGKYATLGDMTFEQAFAVALLVVRGAKTESRMMKKARQKLREKTWRRASENNTPTQTTFYEGQMDFGKFFLSREGGKMIPWSKYLLIAEEESKELVNNTSADELFEAQKRFAIGRKKQEERKKKQEQMMLEVAAMPKGQSLLVPEGQSPLPPVSV